MKQKVKGHTRKSSRKNTIPHIEFDGMDVLYVRDRPRGEHIEVSGKLKKFNSGRAIEYEFEPNWFNNDSAERYYSENWEKIEQAILNKWYKK